MNPRVIVTLNKWLDMDRRRDRIGSEGDGVRGEWGELMRVYMVYAV